MSEGSQLEVRPPLRTLEQLFVDKRAVQEQNSGNVWLNLLSVGF